MSDASQQQGRWLAIVGIGEDGVAGLSPAAKALIANARLVIGGERHIALADGLPKAERRIWAKPISDSIDTILSRRGQPVAVLASGDPYCFGVGSLLSHHVSSEETIAIPAPSSLSLAAARLGWALDETDAISLCGRPLETLAPLLHPKRRLLALSADAETPARVAHYLVARGFGPSQLHVLEALGGPNERIRSVRAGDCGFNDIDALNLLAIEVEAETGANIIPLASGLPDELFEHDGQLTKREIRAVTLSSLAPQAGELLWDIGCGSGSVAVEWLLRHRANRAIGIERNNERAVRAARNATALGVPRLEILCGEAAELIDGLPVPDAIFIGGGGDEGLIARCWQRLRSGGKLVANVVTLETERKVLSAHARFGGTLTRLGVERLDKVGGKQAFRPAMTVTQWSLVKA